MDAANYRLRKIRKDIAGGSHPDRNAQFENIAELIGDYEADGNPWFSMDTKAKEHLGHLYRAGRVRSSAPFLAYDHDFPSWADGVVIPHGIYDHLHLRGHINIGLSHDTSEFACDSLPGTGIELVNNDIPMRHQFCWRVMAVAAIPLETISSSTTCNDSLLTSAWKFASLTIHRTARSTIPSSVASFLIWGGHAAECSLIRWRPSCP